MKSSDLISNFVAQFAEAGNGTTSRRTNQRRRSGGPALVAMRHLKVVCEDCLAAYPHSYEDDCLRLADDSSPRALAPFSNQRHALIQVRGEKEVLLFYKDFAQTAIRLLEMKDDGTFELELAVVWPTKHVVVQQYLSNSLCRVRRDDKQRSEMRQRNVDYSRPTVV